MRDRLVIEERQHTEVTLHGKNYLNFTSNDYLNLANHPDVKKAFMDGANQYGVGSGGSNLVSGYSKPHRQLEEAFCEFLQRDRALLFNSGYHANLGVMTALSNHASTIVADKLCHASLIDGIVLSRAKHYRYQHQDLSHAASLISHHDPSLLVTESLFSMEGSITNAKKLSVIKRNALLIIDDAHGVGILGKNGKGICEAQELTQHDVPCLITPLGKSFGSLGAIVSGSEDLIEYLIQFARTYCYTTSLPPAVSLATLASLKLMQQESWRRETLHALIRYFNKAVKDRGLTLLSDDASPIKSILIGSNEKTAMIQKALLAKNILISCIRPPTVPLNTARCRISLHCEHTEQNIDQLLDELQQLCQHT